MPPRRARRFRARAAAAGGNQDQGGRGGAAPRGGHRGGGGNNGLGRAYEERLRDRILRGQGAVPGVGLRGGPPPPVRGLRPNRRPGWRPAGQRRAASPSDSSSDDDDIRFAHFQEELDRREAENQDRFIAQEAKLRQLQMSQDRNKDQAKKDVDDQVDEQVTQAKYEMKSQFEESIGILEQQVASSSKDKSKYKSSAPGLLRIVATRAALKAAVTEGQREYELFDEGATAKKLKEAMSLVDRHESQIRVIIGFLVLF